jgi:Putative prokaryotic signal transducing protein
MSGTVIRKLEMIKIYSPNDEFELSMIRGVFDTECINYFIHNDHFGSMRVGPQIDLLNKKTIMVTPEDADRAREIITNLLERQVPEEDEQTEYSAGQKLRMIFQALFFGWFIPEKKRRKESPDA